LKNLGSENVDYLIHPRLIDKRSDTPTKKAPTGAFSFGAARANH